jgi:ABC-2 type transport system permease protein
MSADVTAGDGFAVAPKAAALADEPLRELRGPSAVGGGLRRFLELLWLVAVTDFKKTYYGSVLGYVWSIVRPLMLFGILLFVFTQIFRLGGQVNHYPVLLLLGIVLFTFFQDGTTNAVVAVVSREGIVRKTQFPRLVSPLATVLTKLLDLGVNMVAVVIFMFAFGIDPMWTWLFFPIVVLYVLILTMAVGMLLSTLYVRYRDVGIIWGVVATALFYATPVIYPFELVPEKFHNLMLLNPLTPIFVQTRSWIIDRSAPGALTTAGGWDHLLVPLVIYGAICLFAIWKFNRDAPVIAEAL